MHLVSAEEVEPALFWQLLLSFQYLVWTCFPSCSPEFPLQWPSVDFDEKMSIHRSDYLLNWSNNVGHFHWFWYDVCTGYKYGQVTG